jgi:hypothetical protein
MAARKCPQCLTEVPTGHTVAYSDAIECPGCKSPLEVAGASRHIGIWTGLLAGLLAWRLTSGGEGTYAWVLPMVFSFLAYSAVAALATMLTADLRLRPAAPPAEPVAHGSHGGHH